MINAMYQTRQGPQTVEVEALINPDDWFGRTLLMMVCGKWFVVEADNEQDALDAFVDSERYGQMLVISEEWAAELEADGVEVYQAGNFSEPVDLEGVWFPNPPQCKVTISSKKMTWGCPTIPSMS